ncbi:MAG TPA: adenylate/guanylate cyclase domain-containing protein [Acidimicrobiia bacterium]|nr:adenylate/guanylate cyclase domain-containing protein [Acidimicrobiia bacterium]
MDVLDVGTACASCGFENPVGARFCNRCGNPLEVQDSRGAERRQITVVFSDLSGFTAMSEHLDPEDVQAVMRRIFVRATEIIERYSGRVDKLLGDAIMFVFGDPVAHEDDAERAIRATLEIHAAVDELSPEYEPVIGMALRMHSGVNTGVVVTSSGSFDTADTGPLGDTINLAARLEDLSEPGEVLIGAETARLVSDVFELEDHGAHDLKGKSGPVQVMSVTGFRKNRVGPSRRQASFVGRQEELGVLLAAVEAVQDGDGSVIGVEAEAGSGKTRLLEEFRSRVADQVQWLEGRAYAYGENIPYAALIDLISNAVDITEDDTPDSIAPKLRTVIGALVGQDDHILDPFDRLFGLPERPDAGLDKDSFQDRLLESLVAVVDALCERSPTVLVFQDLHWVDPSTLEMIDRLIATITAPAVVIANYRPSFQGTLSGIRVLELVALSPRQTTQMICSLLDVDAPPETLAEFVFDRTDGNPFFVEEIINSLIETETLVRDGSGWAISAPLDGVGLPTSVRGVIAARIDRLDSDRRRVLREASVVGRQFLYEVIRRVATVTATLDPSLADLEHADLIRERSDPDLEYFFKHALTQDVAYEGLLKKERKELHARAATAIEEQFADRLNEVTETLAFHYAQAGIADRAVHYLRAAGTKAMDRYALVEAQSHFENAYSTLVAAGPGPEHDRSMTELILDWALLFYYRARLLDLDELLDRHQDAVDRLDDDQIRMWWLVWRGHAAGFKLDQTHNMAHLDEAIVIAERIGDATGYAYARTWQVWGKFVTGRPLEAIEAAESVTDWVIANRETDPYPFFKSRCVAVFALAFSGQVEAIQGICDDVIEFGRRVGNNRCVAFGHQALAMMHVGLGNYQRGIELGIQASEIAKDPMYRDTSRLTVVAAASLSGDVDLARRTAGYLRSAQAAGVQLPTPLFVDLGEALVKMGDGDIAGGVVLLEQTIETSERTSRLWEWFFGRTIKTVTLARISTGEVRADLKALARNPRLMSVRRASRNAGPALSALRADARAAGMEVIANICDIEEAKLHMARGESTPAQVLLERARTFVDRSDETEGLHRVEALLAQL